MKKDMTASRRARHDSGAKNHAAVIQLFRQLSRHYVLKDWWPADGPFEVAVGAILTQNTNWKNAAAAISNMKASGMMTPERITSSGKELEVLIRPSGSFRRKSKTLRLFSLFLLSTFGGEMALMSAAPEAELREQLLRIHGIGEETADAILLYACGKAVFVADAYAKRFLSRTGAIDGMSTYLRVKEIVEASVEGDAHDYALFHGLIVEFAKELCRKTPLCDSCFIPDCNYRASVRNREERFQR